MSMVFRNCSSTTVGSHEKLDREDLNSTNQSATGLMNGCLKVQKCPLMRMATGQWKCIKYVTFYF